jgi:hypothetical protein
MVVSRQFISDIAEKINNQNANTGLVIGVATAVLNLLQVCIYKQKYIPRQ